MFLSRKYSMCAVLVLFLAALTLFASAQDHKLSPTKQSQIEAAVSKFMASTHVPGLSVAVVENGEYEWASGFGLADVENNSPASEHTLFRLASISKSLDGDRRDATLGNAASSTSTRPFRNIVPAFPQKSRPITTREVMGHLAGIRHYKGGPDDLEIGNTKHFDNPIQAGLDFFKNEPLLSEPGKTFHYSTQGYTLVGCVIEGASGAKYVDFMRQNVFAPGRNGAHPSSTTASPSFPTARASIRRQKSGDRCRTPTSSTRATRFPAADGCRPRKTWRSSKSPS